MTPADRARLIDEEEFRRDSEQALQRALAYSTRKQHERRRQFLTYAFGEEGNTMALDKLHAPTDEGHAPVTFYTFGKQTLSAAQWAHRLGVEVDTLFRQAREYGSMEAALTFCLQHRHKRRGRSAQLIDCNGLRLNRNQWAKRLGITLNAFDSRRRKYGVATAVAMGGPNKSGPKPANRNAPGVVLDFEPSQGTGAGRHLQESTEITFSEEAITE